MTGYLDQFGREYLIRGDARLKTLEDIRPTLIVALTIPVTFLATVAIMRWLGMSLNVITMTALRLAIGMIVDDAIVVAENIFRHARLFPKANEASIEGALDIVGPDASGTFTTVAAFLPLVLMTGIAALFMRPFGLTISAALLVSLLLSLTLVPILFSRMKGLSSIKNDFLGARLLARLDAALQVCLRFSFRHKRLVLTLVAALSLGMAGLTAFLGKASILPPIDEGVVASVRLRPILLTTLTTIAALLPAAIGTAVGSGIFQPFAITVISGLAGGVMATLIIIPTIALAASHHRLI